MIDHEKAVEAWYKALLQTDLRDNRRLDPKIALNKWARHYARDLKDLRNAYTVDRKKIDHRLVQHARINFAYLLGIHLPNFSRMTRLLERVDERFDLRPYLTKETNVFDIGCGTAALSQAFLNFYSQDLNITLLDTNKKFLNIGRSILNETFALKNAPRIVQKSVDQVRFQANKTNIVLIGNLFNELKKQGKQETGFQKKLFELAQTNCILFFLEPATVDSTRRMTQIRDLFANNDFYPVYPCPHNQACPLLGTRDRCYSDFEPLNISAMEFIDNKIGIKRTQLSATAFVFSSKKIAQAKLFSKVDKTLVGMPSINGQTIQLMCDKKGHIDRLRLKKYKSKPDLRGAQTLSSSKEALHKAS